MLVIKAFRPEAAQKLGENTSSYNSGVRVKQNIQVLALAKINRITHKVRLLFSVTLELLRNAIKHHTYDCFS